MNARWNTIISLVLGLVALVVFEEYRATEETKTYTQETGHISYQ